MTTEQFREQAVKDMLFAMQDDISAYALFIPRPRWFTVGDILDRFEQIEYRLWLRTRPPEYLQGVISERWRRACDEEARQRREDPDYDRQGWGCRE